MADEVASLLEELSGILHRISEQKGRRTNGALRAIDFEQGLPRNNDLKFRESPLEFLQHHNDILESLIERLARRSKKG